IGSETKNLYGIEISYLPSFTAWEKQGYLYKNGVVWITKDEKITPAQLTLYEVKDGEDREKEILAKWYPASPTSEVIIPNFSVVEGKSEITGTSAVKLRLNATLGDNMTDVKVTLNGDAETYNNARLLNIEVSVE
ncbi:MAG: hypothetical protein IKY77_03265, partial [Methanocorpusculaceae archaeon]|nr:hypothetical protein [Methanocorpusculaceae archaeon]